MIIILKSATLFLTLFLSTSSLAKDCGPIPPGATFGSNCEMVPVSAPSSKNETRTGPTLEISLQKGTDPEKKAQALLEDFSKKYDLSKYFFTTKVHIQSFVIPHSHPILTLNTRTIDEPDRYLAVFIHEQIHWFFDLNGRAEKTKAFIEKMTLKFPKVPSQEKGGAQDEESTYFSCLFSWSLDFVEESLSE